MDNFKPMPPDGNKKPGYAASAPGLEENSQQTKYKPETVVGQPLAPSGLPYDSYPELGRPEHCFVCPDRDVRVVAYYCPPYAPGIVVRYALCRPHADELMAGGASRDRMQAMVNVAARRAIANALQPARLVFGVIR